MSELVSYQSVIKPSPSTFKWVINKAQLPQVLIGSSGFWCAVLGHCDVWIEFSFRSDSGGAPWALQLKETLERGAAGGGPAPPPSDHRRRARARRGNILRWRQTTWATTHSCCQHRWSQTYSGRQQCVFDSDCPQLRSAWPSRSSPWVFGLSGSREGRPDPSQRCRGTPERNTASAQKTTQAAHTCTVLFIERLVWRRCYLQGEGDVNGYRSSHSSKSEKRPRVTVKHKLGLNPAPHWLKLSG